jgi:predicted enzyme related to lactoylglutathione lyase
MRGFLLPQRCQQPHATTRRSYIAVTPFGRVRQLVPRNSFQDHIREVVHVHLNKREPAMNFVSVRIITKDIKPLIAFYEDVVGLRASWYTEEFAELTTPSCTIAIGSEKTMALFCQGAARGADNHSVILEFLVGDVDREYDRMKTSLTEIVQHPTTQPWGNRSCLFRDPDGNLVNLFTPMTEPAKAKFAGQG